MTARIDPELAAAMAGDPDERYDAIVMADGLLDDLVADLPTDVEVRYEYRLIASVSVRASGRTLNQMAGMKCVKSIEPVRTVKRC